jgi:SHS2 domain-containing protein
MNSNEEKNKFEFLEHTADSYIAAYGKDLNEAFENAALAMFEVMTDVNDVKPRIEDHVEVHASDEYALLYNWLEALLVKFDTSDLLLSRFKVEEITRDTEGFTLAARVWGEKFDPKRHLQKVGVKAVTYHRMEIMRQPGNVTLKFILDI